MSPALRILKNLMIKKFKLTSFTLNLIRTHLLF